MTIMGKKLINMIVAAMDNLIQIPKASIGKLKLTIFGTGQTWKQLQLEATISLQISEKLIQKLQNKYFQKCLTLHTLTAHMKLLKLKIMIIHLREIPAIGQFVQ